MIERLHRLDVTRLAADFSAAVRAAHSEAELKAIRDRNAAEPLDSRVDHVNDFTDSNDLMAMAVMEQLPHVDSWTDLADEMADASTRAKRSDFNLSRILVGCEFSRTVASAFEARGHSVLSCDLKPAEAPGPHYQGDVRDIINDGWHMAIMHPDCTYIAACQLWRCQPKHDIRAKTGHADGWRKGEQDKALEFVRDIGAADIDKMCVENPKSCIGTSGVLPGFVPQLVQPHEFGHDYSKETYLWRHNLPELLKDPADFVPGRDAINNAGNPVKRWANQCDGSGADSRGPSKTRGHERSRFFSGIANAMADQWGGIAAKLTAKATVTQLELFG
jgi:hypothetical protein